ncbi:ADP-ribosylation factor-like protein 2 [Coemansia sp. Benny D115]|nr:ADP-ribosylation factor-like protein 2 [Coemansia sp. Benny D115]
MGLLSIIRKLRVREKQLRILVLGLDNAGKTTAMRRLNNQPIDTISPTLGFSISTLQVHAYRVDFWDVGGQRTIRPYWRNYFEQTDGIIWVVDSADRARLDDCRQELHQLLKEDRLAGASLLVLANKQDLDGALTKEQVAECLQLELLGQSHHWRIFSCSAVTGDGLKEGLDWLVDDVAAHVYMFA